MFYVGALLGFGVYASVFGSLRAKAFANAALAAALTVFYLLLSVNGEWSWWALLSPVLCWLAFDAWRDWRHDVARRLEREQWAEQLLVEFKRRRLGLSST